MSVFTPFLKRVGLFDAAMPVKRMWDVRRRRGKYRGELRALRALKDIHRGKRCFLVATGPSLTMEDVRLLEGEITFGVNSCFRLFDRTDWRPDYYAITDSKVFEDLYAEIAAVPLRTLFVIDRTDARYNCEKKYVLPANPRGLSWRFTRLPDRFPRLFPWTFFSGHIDRSVYLGRTVIYSLLQVAAYMGFSEIYLLGVDCDYTGKKTHADALSYKTGKWQNFDGRNLEQTGQDMIRSFEVANQYARRHGFHIYNATRGGRLEVFPRIALEDALKK